VLTGPDGPAQGRSPSWSIGTEQEHDDRVPLVRGSTVAVDWSPCAGTFTADLAGLPDGFYVLESRATDLAQNLGQVGRSQPYVLDTTAPLPPVVAGPAGPSAARTPTFTWSGEPGARSECQLSRDGVVAPAGSPARRATRRRWTATARDARRALVDAASTSATWP
jgi:hypothetical protein